MEEMLSAAPPSLPLPVDATVCDEAKNALNHADVGELDAAVVAGTCGFMDLSTVAYAQRFGCVELNFTFHDGMKGKDIGVRTYAQKAQEMRKYGLTAVVKVSGYATHEQGLKRPWDWWPWLWERYAALANAGVLEGLLWQFPPSCECTDEMLQHLEELVVEMGPMSTALSVMEFRHPSWYENEDAEATCRRLRLSMAWVHFKNTGWAGKMPSGWSPRLPLRTGRLVYLRLFGSDGRNIGEYSEPFLREQIVGRLPRDAVRVFVFFGQSDMPTQAQANAGRVQELVSLSGTSAASSATSTLRTPSTGAWISGSLPAVGTLVCGRIVRSSRAQMILRLEGFDAQAILGNFHISARGLRPRIGALLADLCVEGVDRDGRVRVTGQVARIVLPKREEKNQVPDTAHPVHNGSPAERGPDGDSALVLSQALRQGPRQGEQKRVWRRKQVQS